MWGELLFLTAVSIMFMATTVLADVGTRVHADEAVGVNLTV